MVPVPPDRTDLERDGHYIRDSDSDDFQRGGHHGPKTADQQRANGPGPHSQFRLQCYYVSQRFYNLKSPVFSFVLKLVKC